MFGPEMATRKPMEDLANALRERYTVITYDLPGCGARDGEALTEEACRRLVEDSVENHATGGASVVLCGINLSAYVLLKSVAAVKQRKVFGLILVGAGKNYYQPSKLLLKGIGMLYKISPASRLWKYTVDELGGQSQLILPKERFEELFLRSPVDYSKWPESVAVMCAPTADFYPKCIEQFRNPILFLPSDKGKDDAGAFLAKSALGTVSSAAPHKHAYASPKFIPGIVAAIDHWIDTNKARLIIQDLDE
jgi:pimeloyl-ACP methyl ester carboxylesterase